jgi:hypothetical protein
MVPPEELGEMNPEGSPRHARGVVREAGMVEIAEQFPIQAKILEEPCLEAHAVANGPCLADESSQGEEIEFRPNFSEVSYFSHYVGNYATLWLFCSTSWNKL